MHPQTPSDALWQQRWMVGYRDFLLLKKEQSSFLKEELIPYMIWIEKLFLFYFP